MAKFTLKLSAKADVFTTVEVDAEDEEQAIAMALNPAFVMEQDWSHYPGSFIPGTPTQEEVLCELLDPSPLPLIRDEDEATSEGIEDGQN